MSCLAHVIGSPHICREAVDVVDAFLWAFFAVCVENDRGFDGRHAASNPRCPTGMTSTCSRNEGTSGIGRLHGPQTVRVPSHIACATASDMLRKIACRHNGHSSEYSSSPQGLTRRNGSRFSQASQSTSLDSSSPWTTSSNAAGVWSSSGLRCRPLTAAPLPRSFSRPRAAVPRARRRASPRL